MIKLVLDMWGYRQSGFVRCLHDEKAVSQDLTSFDTIWKFRCWLIGVETLRQSS